jgi:Phosphopantetheine attachment site/AMP-binding enzyme C-terminal domain
LLNAAQVKILLTDRANLARFQAHADLKVLCVEELPASSSGPLPRLSPQTPQQQPAWLQIHFGPEAAPVLTWTTHAQVVARAKALALDVAAAVSTCVLSSDPQGDSLPMDLLLGPMLGAKTVIVPSTGRVEQALNAALAEGAAVCGVATASSWSSISTVGPAARAQLTAVVTGRAPRELLARLLPSVQRVVTVYVAPRPLSAAFSHVVRTFDEAKVIGKALDARVSVVSSIGAALPVGAPGEIAVNGRRTSGSGLRVRLLSDGLFEAVGEASSTVVLAGQRFDPHEVARVLEQHPAVHKAFVVARGPSAGAERLVAYFQLERGESVTDTALRRHVRSALPEAMVPQLLVELESLPVDEHGAVDPSQLPPPFAGGEQNDFVAPRTPIERSVATFFAETLGVTRVGVYDNFFDLGGSSILCFRVIERIERELGKRLSPRVLLLSSLEQVAAELSGAAPQAPTPALTRPAVVEDLALPGRVLQKLHGFFKR